MATPVVIIDNSANGAEGDVEMTGDAKDEENNGDGSAGGLDQIEPEIPEAPKFVDYLKSPIVELAVTEGDVETLLYAHQAILVQSPHFAGLIASGDSSTPTRRIALTEDVAALASALEYLYKKDYFPALTSSSALEDDDTVPVPDETGVALLRHARIYTLAKKLGLPALATLSHRKIHLVESTARGEIAYARYVYENTTDANRDIRRPVAQFWATRSHVLRHEAEADFRDTCLRFPQFGFDVLTMVLDAQEKRSGKLDAGSHSTGRKRARLSQT